MILFHDCETFCETPINHGTYRYAEGVEVMVHSWAIGVDGEAKVWDATDGSVMPAELEDALAEAETIVGHKYGSFDRLVLRAAGIEIAPERVHDLMVQAVSHGLPGALEKLGIIFKLPLDQQKDKAGKQLIQLFCKPRPKNAKLRRATKATHPVEWARFLDYARQDIPPMQALYKKLPQKNYPCDRERQLWLLDQRMNDRGFKVDIELAHAAIETVKVAKKSIDARTQEMTEDELRSTTQRDKMLEILLESFGVDLPDMTKSTLERRLEDEDLPPPVKELIAQRLQTSTTSNAKYNSLLKSVSSDGRLRGTQQFSGAIRTKRWAGRIFQPQNLPRPDWWYDEAEQELAIPCIKAGSAHLIYDEPIKLVSNAIRGCIIADEDKKLVVSDLEQIEARVLPWLAGEQWKLDMFAAYDAGEGAGLYESTAARILNKTPDEITKDERQAYGKVVELACGYGGATGAFAQFAALYGVDLPEHQVLEIIRSWRELHPALCDWDHGFWTQLDSAARQAIMNPGKTFEAGEHIRFERWKEWLRMELPSGGYLNYAAPAIVADPRRPGSNTISFMGINSYTRRWERLYTYGGKLSADATQTTAREIMAHNLPAIEAKGYAPVLLCHDEVVTEPLDEERFSAEELSKLLSKQPDWAPGLPLNADGFESKRYRK